MADNKYQKAWTVWLLNPAPGVVYGRNHWKWNRV